MKKRFSKLIFFPLIFILAVIGIVFSRNQNSARPSPVDLPRTEDLWKPYNVQALMDARAAKKPVIIDFYATWCGPCKFLDKAIFQTQAFQKQSAGFVLLRSDMSDRDSAEVRNLNLINQISGLPTIIFLSDDGRELTDLRLSGVISDAKIALQDFLLRMEYAKGKKPVPANLQ